MADNSSLKGANASTNEDHDVLLAFEEGGTINNWPKWFPHFLSAMTILYGDQASVLIRTNKKFKNDSSLKDFIPPGQHSKEDTQLFTSEFWKARLRENEQIRKNAEKFMFSMLAWLSEDSRHLL